MFVFDLRDTFSWAGWSRRLFNRAVLAVKKDSLGSQVADTNLEPPVPPYYASSHTIFGGLGRVSEDERLRLLGQIPEEATHLDISGQDLNCLGGNLSAFLRKIPSHITHLNLSQNWLFKISDNDVLRTAFACVTASHLNISGNGLHQKSIAELKSIFQNIAPCVTHLTLRYNCLYLLNAKTTENEGLLSWLPPSIQSIDIRDNRLELELSSEQLERAWESTKAKQREELIIRTVAKKKHQSSVVQPWQPSLPPVLYRRIPSKPSFVMSPMMMIGCCLAFTGIAMAILALLIVNAYSFAIFSTGVLMTSAGVGFFMHGNNQPSGQQSLEASSLIAVTGRNSTPNI